MGEENNWVVVYNFVRRGEVPTEHRGRKQLGGWLFIILLDEEEFQQNIVFMSSQNFFTFFFWFIISAGGNFQNLRDFCQTLLIG